MKSMWPLKQDAMLVALKQEEGRGYALKMQGMQFRKMEKSEMDSPWGLQREHGSADILISAQWYSFWTSDLQKYKNVLFKPQSLC